MSKIILTGVRPTGRLHVGHYVGSLKRRVELQNSGEFDKIFIMIADAQALTDNFDNLEKIEVLPYHTMGIPKYESLGIDYPLKGIDNATKEQADKALEIILNNMKKE